MKIKMDENLPLQLATTLGSLGHDVHTTSAEGLAGRTDLEIWRTAQGESRFLITQDLDFSDVRRFTPGSHAGILLVVCTRLAGTILCPVWRISSWLKTSRHGRAAS